MTRRTLPSWELTANRVAALIFVLIGIALANVLGITP
ncbi:hypothetical protein CLV72_11821 [Allonocardiopsis opalescens]|uniref:Uncharacterized protein n=1 Tax=Allonocardiopsis opalescens TaxID=1144618 RepID=A0A2T0PP61_9ACTN|nr:hypothetical protein CLV72_11821 [Allonocardiopsis opalescens]